MTRKHPGLKNVTLLLGLQVPERPLNKVAGVNEKRNNLLAQTSMIK